MSNAAPLKYSCLYKKAIKKKAMKSSLYLVAKTPWKK